MSYILNHIETGQSELEYLKAEFKNLDIYEKNKNRFRNRSTQFLWLVYSIYNKDAFQIQSKFI